MRGCENSGIVQYVTDLVTCISLYDGCHVSYQRQHDCMCMGLEERGERREEREGGKREGRECRDDGMCNINVYA